MSFYRIAGVCFFVFESDIFDEQRDIDKKNSLKARMLLSQFTQLREK